MVRLASVAHNRALSQRAIALSGNKNLTVNARFLFICAVPTVRLQFAKLSYNAGCPPTLATWDSKTCKPKIVSSNHCASKNGKVNQPRRQKKNQTKKNKDPLQDVFVSDLLSGLYIIYHSTKEELDETICAIDEPTVSADKKDSLPTRIVAGIMSKPVKQMVLSSATLPNPEELKPIINNFLELYPSGTISYITAMISQIGCQLATFDGIYHYPHNVCKKKR